MIPRPPRILVAILLAFVLVTVSSAVSEDFWTAETFFLSVVALAVVLTVLLSSIRPVRAWVAAVDMRVFLGLHLLRFAGASLIVLASRNLIPSAFGDVGWAEVAVASTAVGVMWVLSMPVSRFPRSVVAWNLLGSIDLVVTMGKGLQLASERPSEVALATRFPLAVYFITLVPLFLASHVLLFLRVRTLLREPEEGEDEKT